MKDEVLKLHQLYCDLTGQAGMGLRFERERLWFDWVRCGWGEPELRVVVRYLKAGIAEGKRNHGALKFSNLIGQPDRFEEDLFEARRVQRPARPRTIEVERRDGDIRRLVEVEALDETFDVGKFFDGVREKMGVPNKATNPGPTKI